ncbi:MAG: cobalamin-binding protein [Candidatus Atribacteria bacterium]|nr:cobalamin-binding protein [Candidatus Atribacteria bacterium]
MIRRFWTVVLGLYLLVFVWPIFSQEVILRDDWGRECRVLDAAQRIISLSPANTEIIFALGLGDRLIGVTSYCNYPKEAQTKEKVGNVTEIDLERVVRLEPDLVLAGSLTPREVVDKLEELGIRVFVLDAHTIEEVFEDIGKVAILAGIENEGEEFVKILRDELTQITQKVIMLPAEQKPRLLHVIWHDPIWTAGRNTFIDEFIRLGGGVNVVSDLEGYITLSLEELLRRNPDVITVVSAHGSEAISYDFLLSDERLQAVRAIQERKVFLVDSDLVSRPGPRVVEALAVFARILHPETFGAYESPAK